MDFPKYIDDSLRESSLGSPLSSRTLRLKLRLSEQTQSNFRDECFVMESKLTKKDKTIEGITAESSMNLHAVKMVEEENGRLIIRRADLLTQFTKYEDECSFYVQDLQALDDFKNQADERVKEAEARAHRLEDETSNLSEELQSFKQQSEVECTENILVDALISTLINKDEVASTANSFLEANSGLDSCQKMLKIWDGLKPSTHNVLALASEVKNLHKDKDILRMNLIKAEEEVTVLFDENNVLDTENILLSDLLDSRGSHSS